MHILGEEPVKSAPKIYIREKFSAPNNYKNLHQLINRCSIYKRSYFLQTAAIIQGNKLSTKKAAHLIGTL